jgi:hypothetical protein
VVGHVTTLGWEDYLGGCLGCLVALPLLVIGLGICFFLLTLHFVPLDKWGTWAKMWVKIIQDVFE